ncbi:uncharacterized protein LOC130663896 [Microplitis mediator]|uniref:uncharacterized protein LOC130663896 n=1 Tax=Microplitis mediator TaxID=375433 RepID=UPI002555D061|nr:uncharacterized protein LOC130663896 [Microplitis mediator]
MLVASVILCLIVGSQASVPGLCPNVKGEVTDLNEIFGRWYLQKASRNVADFTLICTELYWNLPNEYGSSNIVYTSYSKLTKEYVKSVSEATLNDSGVTIVYHTPVAGPMSVNRYIFTDNRRQYGIVWSCENNGTMHDESAFFYSKNPRPNRGDMQRFINYKLAVLGLNIPKLVDVNTEYCY